MAPIIFLLSGWSEAGKDTAADILVERYGFQKLAFAEVPKEVVSTKYNFPLEWTKTQEGKATEIQTEAGPRKVRDLIIEYANGERLKNPQIWAELTAQKIVDACKGKQERFVISDWRFIDELVGIKKSLQNVLIYPIQIRRSGQMISPVADNTEYALLGFPFHMTIENPGDKFLLTNIGRQIYSILRE